MPINKNATSKSIYKSLIKESLLAIVILSIDKVISLSSNLFTFLHDMRLRLMLCMLFVLSGGYILTAHGQTATEKNDTWYLWIDTEVPIDGAMVSIVSNKPMVITCCPKSTKYRKYVKKAAKWIKENVASEYNGELSLMKIQDEMLALATINRLKDKEGVLVIDYSSSCK